MKENIIRAILYQDMSVKWKAPDDELKDDVNIHLNVHQKARQFVEVELGDFLLSDGEAVLVAFEKTIDGEVNHINPTWMRPIEDEQNAFRLQIPTLVHNTPGEWGVQFFIAVDFNTITGEYTDIYPFDKAKFSEYSSFIDDGLIVPTSEHLSAIFEHVIHVREEAEKQAVNASKSADNAQTSATQSAEILQEVKAHTTALYRYKGSLKNYEDLPKAETAEIQVGDTYNVETAYEDYPEGTNFAWNGETWDALAGTIKVENMAKASIFTINATVGIEYTFDASYMSNLKKDWGDGTIDYLPTHTYSSNGKYSIKVYGISVIQSIGLLSGGALISVSLSDSVKEIEYDAFCYSNLETVVFGEGVKKIGAQAFMDCARLRLLEFKGTTPPIIDATAFSYVNSIEKVIVPRESVEAYSSLFDPALIDGNARLSDILNSIESLPQADYNQNDKKAKDYIKNRPFYEAEGEELFTWAGNMDGRELVNLAEGLTYVKVSDEILTAEDFSDGVKIYSVLENLKTGENSELEITTYKIDDAEALLAINTTATTVIISIKNQDEVNNAIGGGVAFQNGTYFLYQTDNETLCYTSRVVLPSIIKKIDKKFLPNFISQLVEGTLQPYSIPFWDGEKFAPLLATTYADGRQVHFKEGNKQLALQSNMIRVRRYADDTLGEEYREVELSANGGFQFKNAFKNVIYGSDRISIIPVKEANTDGTYSYDDTKTIKIYLPTEGGTFARLEDLEPYSLKTYSNLTDPGTWSQTGQSASYGYVISMGDYDTMGFYDQSKLTPKVLSFKQYQHSGVFNFTASYSVDGVSLLHDNSGTDIGRHKVNLGYKSLTFTSCDVGSNSMANPGRGYTEYSHQGILHHEIIFDEEISGMSYRECTLKFPLRDGTETIATDKDLESLRVTMVDGVSGAYSAAVVYTDATVKGLPQKAGWKISKYVFNHSFNFTSDSVVHSGFGSFIEYEDINDSTRHIITADIQITASEDITNPEDFKISLVTLGTKWKSAGMLVNALFPDGFKDATKYTHMTVDKYSWLMDQTEGSVGLLDGVGAVLPQVYAVRDTNGYNASLWGIAVELTKTNSGKSLHIDGKHIYLTFYDFHTVTN